MCVNPCHVRNQIPGVPFVDISMLGSSLFTKFKLYQGDEVAVLPPDSNVSVREDSRKV